MKAELLTGLAVLMVTLAFFVTALRYQPKE
jgi:hypothetical protein